MSSKDENVEGAMVVAVSVEWQDSWSLLGGVATRSIHLKQAIIDVGGGREIETQGALLIPFKLGPAHAIYKFKSVCYVATNQFSFVLTFI